MQLKISNKNEKPLLSRTEVIGEIAYDTATPSRIAVKKEISKAIKAAEELVIIKEITPIFGARKSMVKAHVYKNAEDVKKYESSVILKRNAKAPKGQKKEGEQ